MQMGHVDPSSAARHACDSRVDAARHVPHVEQWKKLRQKPGGAGRVGLGWSSARGAPAPPHRVRTCPCRRRGRCRSQESRRAAARSATAPCPCRRTGCKCRKSSGPCRAHSSRSSASRKGRSEGSPRRRHRPRTSPVAILASSRSAGIARASRRGGSTCAACAGLQPLPRSPRRLWRSAVVLGSSYTAESAEKTHGKCDTERSDRQDHPRPCNMARAARTRGRSGCTQEAAAGRPVGRLRPQRHQREWCRGGSLTCWKSEGYAGQATKASDERMS